MITAPKIHTDLLWDLSCLFIGLAVVYFICVFFFRNRISKRNMLVKQRKRELSPMISEFLFYEEEASKDEKSNYVSLKIEIRQLLKDDFNQKVLSEVLLDLRKDVSGGTQKRLFKLYQDLGLHTDNFKNLKSWRWEKVSKAILNLTQMQVAEAYSFVTKFINDKRATIRKQAEIAIVTLKPEGINYFLDTTKYKISEWQQLKLIDVLRNEDNYQPPRFKDWLTSTNRSVVLFALRLMKFYNQNDANASLIELVKHRNSAIKLATIGCIEEFHIVEALSTLKLVFWKSSTDLKIAILNAIGVLGNESDIQFLQLIEKKEANFSVKSKAQSSINTITPGSIMPSKGVANTTNYKIPEDIKIKKDEALEFELEAEFKKITPETYSPNIISNNTSIDQQEEIINNDAKSHLMEENQVPKQPKTTSPIANEIASQDKERFNFYFLPVVVEKATVELSDIVVNFEEVVAEEEVKEPKKTIPSVEIKEEEIAFLPLVIDLIAEVSPEHTSEEKPETIPSINEIEVQFDTVIPITELEVQFDEIKVPSQNGPLQEFGDTNEISNTQEKIKDEPEIDSSIELEETVEEKTASAEINIPKSALNDPFFEEIVLYKENTEESRMQLLDDLAEMGDEREIPLLKELLVNEKYNTVKDRAKRLIMKFSNTEEKSQPDTTLKPFNVFEDLFRICDKEAKLILMDEIVAVGDEGELDFLKDLVEYEQKEISTKAARILKELKAKLSASEENNKKDETLLAQIDNKTVAEIEVLIAEKTLVEYDSMMEALQIAPPQNSDMFELTFELNEPLDTVDTAVKTDILDSIERKNRESFFNQIYSFFIPNQRGA